MTQSKTTVVLGASPKADRYSNKAIRLLVDKGHRVIPVHPAQKEIEGLAVVHNIADITEPVDTVTVYLSPETGAKLTAAIVALHPQRVILNPGAESEELESGLKAAGIASEHACTLVLLQTDQY